MNIPDLLIRLRALKEMGRAQPEMELAAALTDAQRAELAAHAIKVIESQNWWRFPVVGRHSDPDTHGHAAPPSDTGAENGGHNAIDTHLPNVPVVHSDPARPIANSGRRMVFTQWTKAEVTKQKEFCYKVGKTFLVVARAFQELETLMSPTDTVGVVWSRLKPETQTLLADRAGMRRLTA